jgi:DNA-binding IclR family transcriptional regulator
MADKPQYAAPAVEKAFAVLELISHHPEGIRVVEVVNQLSVPKTTAFVLIRSLEGLGYLVRDDENRYRLTFKLFELGMRAMTQADVVSASRAHLDRLVRRTGLTVHLAALEKGDAVYLSKIDGPGLGQFDTYVGKRSSAHLTAVGKAILAFLSNDARRDVLAQLDFASGTRHAIRSPSLLDKEFQRIRQVGYAVEDGEEVEGVRCIGAPIRRSHDGVIASVGVIGLQSTLTDDRLSEIGDEVARTAEAISHEILPLAKPARLTHKSVL